MERRRHAADVPSITHREERHQPDSGMLGCMCCSRHGGLIEARHVEDVLWNGVPNRGGVQRLLRQVEWLLVKRFVRV
jgi:hypothetical protein